MSIIRTTIKSAVWVVCATAVGACALQQHDPKPLDAERMQSVVLARNPDDPGLRDVLARRGVDTSRWPLAQWDLAALTALAYEMRDDIALARAERTVADAARETARTPRNPRIEPFTEHHSKRGSDGSPWTIGLALDLALTGSSRRTAGVALADARLREADWQLAQRAWQVRAEVRDAYAAWLSAVRLGTLIDAELALRRQESMLLDKRLALGAVSAAEPARARARQAEAERDQLAAVHAISGARGELARVIGIAGEALGRLKLDETEPEPADYRHAAAALQRAALNDRLDVCAALERYAASDAQLQLEIARQIPEFSIKPGYAWDQGDNRWSLGLSALLPLFDRNQGPIAEARARRDVEATRFLGLQAAAIAELDRARLALKAADTAVEAAQATQSREAEIAARVERRFGAGDADRLELASARLALAAAQRRLADAEAARMRALGALEDAVQRPLNAIPTAVFAHSGESSDSAKPQ